jgi:nucleotide-binding universal stress UspA family protein
MFKTIVFGTDGSAGSNAAYELVRELATRTGARVFAVHVVEMVGGKGGRYPLAADEDRIEDDVQRQVDELSEAGVGAEVIVERVDYGGPARVIADVAHKVGADLIVVGNRGRSPISELLSGSVPRRLLELARRPVLIVPPPLAADSSSQ